MRSNTFLIGILLLTGGCAGTAGPQGTERWIAGWTTPPIGYEPNIRDALGRPIRDETVRQHVQVMTTGTQLRVRLTNELSPEPLRVGDASVVRLTPDGTPLPGSLRRLTFAGSAGVHIPGFAPILSDALDFPVTAGESLAISIYYPDGATPAAHAQMVEVVSGNAVERVTFASPLRVRAPGLVTGVDVRGSSATRVLVTFGDSITEGAGASHSMSWPHQLSRLLRDNKRTGCWTVANQGISGNRLLNTGRGPTALSRFDRDVLAVPGATHVVIVEGINDIGKVRNPTDDQPSVDRLIGAYEQLLSRARSRGLKVMIGTLLPYAGAAYADAAGEMRRQAVNQWIRANAARFDAMIDFDAAMRDPSTTDTLRSDEHIGDFLHPNDKGYAVMARTALPAIQAQGCR